MKPAELGQIERELASGGFVWEPRRGKPIDYATLPPDPKRGRKLKAGLIKPRDASERAWLAKQMAKGAV